MHGTARAPAARPRPTCAGGSRSTLAGAVVPVVSSALCRAASPPAIRSTAHADLLRNMMAIPNMNAIEKVTTEKVTCQRRPGAVEVKGAFSGAWSESRSSAWGERRSRRAADPSSDDRHSRFAGPRALAGVGTLPWSYRPHAELRCPGQALMDGLRTPSHHRGPLLLASTALVTSAAFPLARLEHGAAEACSAGRQTDSRPHIESPRSEKPPHGGQRSGLTDSAVSVHEAGRCTRCKARRSPLRVRLSTVVEERG